MKATKEKWSKTELAELLERKVLFLEILRKLHERLQIVFDRPESLVKLANEMKACETQIVKRYFFPIDKTIEAFTKQPSKVREEMIKTNEDIEKLLHFIDVFDEEVMRMEGEIQELKEENRKLREMLTKD